MDWQLIAVGLIVAGAIVYLSRQTWRQWFARKAGCGGGCGCSAAKSEPAEKNGEVVVLSADRLTRRSEQRGE